MGAAACIETHCRHSSKNDTAGEQRPREESVMGLLVMIRGLVLFFGAHTLTTQREVRARVIAASGEGGYKLGYALVSIVGIALIACGFGHYRAGGMIDVWEKWYSRHVLRLRN